MAITPATSELNVILWEIYLSWSVVLTWQIRFVWVQIGDNIVPFLVIIFVHHTSRYWARFAYILSFGYFQ